MKDIIKVVVFGGAFLVLFLPLVVSDSMFFPYITGKNFYFRILVELMLAAWAVLALLDAQYRPRFSWLLVTSGVFVAVVFLADIFGQYPPKSLWSNFERMDGFVTVFHFWLYFVILGSVLKNHEIDFLGYRTTVWKLFLGTAMIAALGVAFTAFQQLAGNAAISQGGWRITGTLGNAAYMAIYMLFNTFIALWLMVQSRTRGWQVVFGLAALLFMFLLVQTATRGTVVGLVGGLSFGALYIALSHREYPQIRTWALGVVAIVILIAGGIYLNRDSSFVQESPILQQASNISLDQLKLRMTIWKLAVPGIEERPILGWGQGNFNYVFNREYVPELYYAEPWYDRVHNIVLDWLIAAGALGLLAYLSIFVAILYYLIWRPLRGQASAFSPIERGLLFGIVVGYTLHNLVVFDNVVSYIFFAVLLALIHSRESTAFPALEKKHVDADLVTRVVLPVAVLAAGLVIYSVNVPSMLAAQDLIMALKAQTPEAQLDAFKAAYDRGSFADQEITEQLVQATSPVFASTSVSDEKKQTIATFVEQHIAALAAEKPGDARVHQFFSSFYRSIGAFDKAAEQAAIAHDLSPRKPSLVIEQGLTEFFRQDYESMNTFFKDAYDLAPLYAQAQIFYAAGQLYIDPAFDVHTIVTDQTWPAFAANAFALQAANQAQRQDLLIEMTRTQLESTPSNVQLWVNLTAMQYEAGDTAGAIATLEEAADAVPQFKPTAECFIGNLQAGRDPNEGC